MASGFGISSYGPSPYGFGSTPPKIAISHLPAYETGDFSFVCDVYVTDSSDFYLFGKDGEWWVEQVGGNWKASVVESGATYSSSTYAAVYDKWVQVGVRFTGEELYLYVDNSYVGKCGSTGTLRDISTDDWGSWLTGSIKRMRYWNVAISVGDIVGLMASDAVPQSANLVGEWLMTDGVPGVATDTSVTANDGTVVGSWVGGQQDGFNSGSWVVPVDGAITDALHWITIFGGFYVLTTSLPIDGTPSGFTYHDDYPTAIPAFTTIYRFSSTLFRVGPPKPPGLMLGVTYPMMAVEEQVHIQQPDAMIGRRTSLQDAGSIEQTVIGREDGSYAYAQDAIDSSVTKMLPGIYSFQDGPLLGYDQTLYDEFTKQFTNCIVDTGRLIDYDYWRMGIVEGMQCIINNVRYTVDSINALGEITLDTAPPNGTGVTADFYLVGFRYVKPAFFDEGFGV